MTSSFPNGLNCFFKPKNQIKVTASVIKMTCRHLTYEIIIYLNRCKCYHGIYLFHALFQTVETRDHYSLMWRYFNILRSLYLSVITLLTSILLIFFTTLYYFFYFLFSKIIFVTPSLLHFKNRSQEHIVRCPTLNPTLRTPIDRE